MLINAPLIVSCKQRTGLATAYIFLRPSEHPPYTPTIPYQGEQLSKRLLGVVEARLANVKNAHKEVFVTSIVDPPLGGSMRVAQND